MEEKDLEFFKHLLIQWMEELLDHADQAVEGLLDSRENLADPVDRATVESDRVWTLCIRDPESKLIKKNAIRRPERRSKLMHPKLLNLPLANH